MPIVEMLTNYIDTNGWWMFITQVIIAGTGIPAIMMTQSTNANVRKWACIVAVSGQPFWFIMAWITGAWGVFIMSFFYTFAWCKGVWSFWIRPYLRKKEKEKIESIWAIDHCIEIMRFLPVEGRDDLLYLEGTAGNRSFDRASLINVLKEWSESTSAMGEAEWKVVRDMEKAPTAAEKLKRVNTVNLSPDTARFRDVRLVDLDNGVIAVTADVVILKESLVPVERLCFSPRFLVHVGDEGVSYCKKLVAADYRLGYSAGPSENAYSE